MRQEIGPVSDGVFQPVFQHRGRKRNNRPTIFNFPGKGLQPRPISDTTGGFFSLAFQTLSPRPATKDAMYGQETLGLLDYPFSRQTTKFKKLAKLTQAK